MRPQTLLCVRGVETCSWISLDGSGGPNHWKLWIRDLDGYTVVLACPDESAG